MKSAIISSKIHARDIELLRKGVARGGVAVHGINEDAGVHESSALRRSWYRRVAVEELGSRDLIHTVFNWATVRFFSLNSMRDEPLEYSFAAGATEGTTVVTLNGPLTLSNLFAFQGELRAMHSPMTIFDLSKSEYMDSAGLGVLVNFYVSAEKNGRKMALAGVNQRIEALLDMTHVKALLRLYPTVGEAEAAG